MRFNWGRYSIWFWLRGVELVAGQRLASDQWLRHNQRAVWLTAVHHCQTQGAEMYPFVMVWICPWLLLLGKGELSCCLISEMEGFISIMLSHTGWKSSWAWPRMLLFSPVYRDKQCALYQSAEREEWRESEHWQYFHMFQRIRPLFVCAVSPVRHNDLVLCPEDIHKTYYIKNYIHLPYR